MLNLLTSLTNVSTYADYGKFKKIAGFRLKVIALVDLNHPDLNSDRVILVDKLIIYETEYGEY